jgi:hypothetical protein
MLLIAVYGLVLLAARVVRDGRLRLKLFPQQRLQIVVDAPDVLLPARLPDGALKDVDAALHLRIVRCRAPSPQRQP